jgi:hypothetical protein
MMGRRIRRELMCRFTSEGYWALAIDRYLPAEQGRLKVDHLKQVRTYITAC